MTNLLQDLTIAVEKNAAVQAERSHRAQHPKGWEPHVEERGDGTATAVSQPTEKETLTDEELILGWKMDPKVWEIVGPVNCRRWQTYDERWLYYYKANLRRVDVSRSLDVDELCREIMRHKPNKAKAVAGENAFVVCFADIQMGKDDGDGAEGTAKRTLEAISAVTVRINELRKIGRSLGVLYVLGMGDLIEQCSGFYPQQTFRAELNHRDQVKVVTRLILAAIKEWAPLFERVVVAAVGGNHGEQRVAGKSYTDFADNDDLVIFENIAMILNENPDTYGHVSFVIPNEELTIVLDICGTVTALTHGQVARTGGKTPQQKLSEWWKGQAHGMQPAGDAVLLISAHYHHFSLVQHGVKTHIQCPAMEGGSEWFTQVTGLDSPRGLLTLVVGGGTYDDVKIVR